MPRDKDCTMPDNSKIVKSNQWLTAIEAGELLEVSRRSVPRIAAAAGVRIRQLPGIRQPRYCKDDLVKLLDSSVRLAGEAHG